MLRAAERCLFGSDGALKYHFPCGHHVFPANPTRVVALDRALQDALREERVVTKQEVNLARAKLEVELTLSEIPSTTEPVVPFDLRLLRLFLKEHRPDFLTDWKRLKTLATSTQLAMAADALEVSEDRLVTDLAPPDAHGALVPIPTSAYAVLSTAVPRILRLRGMNAPDVIVAAERNQALALLEQDSFRGEDICFPDAAICAAMGTDAMLRDLALLGAQCCIAPDAVPANEAEMGALGWVDFGGQDERAPPQVEPSECVVRTTLRGYDDYVDLDRFSYALTGGEARVAISLTYDEYNEDGTLIFGWDNNSLE